MWFSLSFCCSLVKYCYCHAADLIVDEAQQPQVEKEKRTMQSSNQDDESVVPPQVEQS